MGTRTTNLSLYKPAVGETGWGATVNTNWDTLDANSSLVFFRGWLAGLGTATNAGSPTTKIDILPGVAMEAGNTALMSNATTLTKDISASWAVGSGNGGRGTGVSLSASTWYHIFLIKRTDTGVVDAYFDTSISAANIPTSYTISRRIGSIKTDGSSNILNYTQDGDYFRFKASVLDYNLLNPGNAAVTVTLGSVPPGVNTQAFINALLAIGTVGTTVYFSDLSANDEAPPMYNVAITAPGFTMGSDASNITRATQITVRTNTAQQIRYRITGGGDGNARVAIVTLGWIDSRGRNA